MSNKISVITVVYNDVKHIRETMESFFSQTWEEKEYIVIDGGSTDGTSEELAREFRVLATSKGRARQMNEGARATSGDVIFFLHADSILPPSPVDQILRVARTHDAGCFGIRFDRRHPVLWFCSWMSNARVRVRGIAYGDQGIFIRRELFEEVGGFPDLPIMEDLQLSLNLRARGVRFAMTRSRITTSSRRFGEGTVQILKTWCAMVPLRKMYREGADIQEIAARYRDIR